MSPRPLHLLVIIDHHATRIYEVERPRDANPKRIEPYDPHGFQRHLVHRSEGHGTGQRAPEEPSYYDAVAKTLAGADAILVMGHGAGKSSASGSLGHVSQHPPSGDGTEDRGGDSGRPPGANRFSAPG